MRAPSCGPAASRQLSFSNRVGHSIDQADRQEKLGAQLRLASGHFALVPLVVQTGEMKQAVQQEDFDLNLQRMPVGLRLTPSGIQRDGEVAGMMIRNLTPAWGKLSTSVALFLPR